VIQMTVAPMPANIAQLGRDPGDIAAAIAVKS
jgi:hypothetical protein